MGIICIILGVSLIGAIDILNGENASLNSQVTSLQSQVRYFNDVIVLDKTETWVNNQTISQPEDSWSNWTFTSDFAGYVSVQVFNLTILNPLAEVVYSYHGINYDQQTEIGTIEGAAFPIMPSSIEIRVGNGPHVAIYNASGVPILVTVTETVAITYYY